MNDRNAPGGVGGLAPARLVLYAIPVVTIAMLMLLYELWPEFYAEYVLDYLRREDQAVEIATFVCALAGGLLTAWSAWSLWRDRRSMGTGGGAMIVAAIGAAALFFAGEEVSWGQEFFGWDTPEAMRAHTVQTNLHNITTGPVRVQTLASLFLIVTFVVLPISWRLDRSSMLPRSWRVAVAEGPVVFCMAVAFVWRGVKDVYRLRYPDHEADEAAHPWYWGFVEQLPEQKEMLVAVGLLMYGAYRLRLVRRLVRRRGRTADASSFS